MIWGFVAVMSQDVRGSEATLGAFEESEEQEGGL